jgi:hypothetical protein
VPATQPAAKASQPSGVAAPPRALAAASDALNDAVVSRGVLTWPVIEPHEAERRLGDSPAVIPGVVALGLRRNPADSAEIAILQRVGNDVVWLFERRTAAAGVEMRQAQGYISNERLARYVRSLRIEIAGTLPADSLSVLLGSIR